MDICQFDRTVMGGNELMFNNEYNNIISSNIITQ